MMNMVARMRTRGASRLMVGLLALGVCLTPVYGPASRAWARGPQPDRDQGRPGPGRGNDNLSPGRGYDRPGPGRNKVQPSPGRNYVHPSPGRNNGRPAPGRGYSRPSPGIVKTLPRGHGSLVYKGQRYYYDRGRYYRHHRYGYVVVPPPRRMVVPRLPLGFVTLVVAGLTYFTYMGVYYQRVPSGYVVVAPPAGAPPAPPADQIYGSVTVTAAALNVRQGPGRGYVVVQVVPLGEALSVLATAPGWLYVQTISGQLGWVDQRFTTPLAPAASG